MSNGDKMKIVEPLPTRFRILTWNVDFATPQPVRRLKTALAYIQKDVFSCKSGEAPDPCCILLQEVQVRAFQTILDNEWIRKHFAITPVTPERWPNASEYGNVTLVSHSIPACHAWSLEFANSRMSRNALLVDLKLSSPDRDNAPVTIRVANTHLESLSEGAVARPLQMVLIAKLLKEKMLHGGIVGGDMNAIGRSDVPKVADAGLVDTWGGDDEDEDGYTWGFQPKSRYPPGRLDKILITPDSGFMIEEPKKVGVGVRTADGEWTSDHYGLLTTVSVI
jgi:tyrosyl-DNA phosphodiesterase 2